MGWRRDEVWLDTDVLWFREPPRRRLSELGLALPALAAYGADAMPFLPAPTGLEASRRRRLAKQSDRRRKLATRTVPAVALVLGSATMLPVAALRSGNGHKAGALQEDPPSLTFRFDVGRLDVPGTEPLRTAAASAKGAAAALARTKEFEKVAWHRATSVGLPFSGRLLNGTQLPLEGPDWVTWNPIADSVPNQPGRVYGNEHTIRKVLTVLGAYRASHPDAPRVVIGDISRRDGGRMDDHVSHQNGLDVDVYYPRLDHNLSAPITPSQVDRRLTQDLLDRFVAAGAQVVFVGYSTGLRGPSGVVVPYPNHENHMHVRFPQPG